MSKDKQGLICKESPWINGKISVCTTQDSSFYIAKQYDGNNIFLKAIYSKDITTEVYYRDGEITKIAQTLHAWGHTNKESKGSIKVSIHYDSTGNIVSHYHNYYYNNTHFVKQGAYTSYHENGIIAEIGNYKFGQEDGMWYEFDEKGELIARKIYKEGEVVKEDTYLQK